MKASSFTAGACAYWPAATRAPHRWVDCGTSRRRIGMESCPCAVDDDAPQISARFHSPATKLPALNARGGPYRRAVLMLSAVPVVDWLAGLRSEAAGAQLEGAYYEEKDRGYRLLVPDGWEKVGKAGADALFRDPMRKSTTIGVTVYPSRVKSTEDFGTVGQAKEKLAAAEEGKDGFLSLTVLEESSKFGRDGALLYSYDYEINTTRARKRIITAVTIFNSRLFIVTGTCKCPKAACGVEEERIVASLKECVDSFDPLAL